MQNCYILFAAVACFGGEATVDAWGRAPDKKKQLCGIPADMRSYSNKENIECAKNVGVPGIGAAANATDTHTVRYT